MYLRSPVSKSDEFILKCIKGLSLIEVHLGIPCNIHLIKSINKVYLNFVEGFIKNNKLFCYGGFSKAQNIKLNKTKKIKQLPVNNISYEILLLLKVNNFCLINHAIVENGSLMCLKNMKNW